MRPPRLPRVLVALLAAPEDRRIIIGDLDEEFTRRASISLIRAHGWYWAQVSASLPSVVRSRWRRAALFTDFGGDIRRACRGIWRRPGFAAAAVLTMALGSGITTAVVSVVEAVLLRPLPYGNGERVHAIQESDGVRSGANFSWADFIDLSTRLHAFSAIAGYSGASRTLTGHGAAERLPAIEVTPRFFEVLGITPALGRDFTPADALRGAPPVVVLSDGAWRRRLAGDPAALGATVILGGVPHTVVGVLPRAFIFPPRADPELWLPLRPSAAQEARPYLHFLDVVGARRPDMSAAVAAEDVESVARAWQHSGDAWHASTGVRAVPLREEMVAGVRPALLLLLGAALLVLLAAAINVSGLILARASGRAREVSVRAALGATRLRLARQLVVEALCLGALGSCGGLLLGYWSVSAFAAITPARFRAVLPYADNLSVSPRAAWLSVSLTLAAIVAASLLPALRRPRPTGVLATGVRATAGRAETRLRGALVAAQIALAVALLAGTALLARSVGKLTRVSTGFEIAGLVSGRLNFPPGRYETPDALTAAVDRVLERVRAVPGVIGAEAINQLPLSGLGNSGDFAIVGRASTLPSNPLIRDVTPGYFALMRIPLLEGRRIEPSDSRASQRVVVVNRTLARHYFASGSAIGQRIVFEFFDGKPQWTIVGVVGDERFGDLDRPMAPVVYFPYAQDPEGSFSLVVRAAAPESAGESLRAAIASIEPELPLFGLRTLERTAAESNAMFLRALVSRLLAWFSLAALLLAGVGVYGVLSEALAARTREIGVRMALGATRGAIARLVFVSGARPALAGLAGGTILTVAAAPAVRSLLFGVTLLDVPSLAVVTGLLLAVTGLACALPAWRAIRLPVTTALRND
ncbi:MAG: ABC transporter permease [Vicinamibacterales bacterium]